MVEENKYEARIELNTKDFSGITMRYGIGILL
jgi:hypothetical protein